MQTTRLTKQQQARAPAEKNPGSAIKDIAGFFLHLGVVIAAVWAVFTFIFGVNIVSGEAMYPRIRDGDVLLYYRMQKDIRTGDVLVVNKDGQELVGRVVAVGGETVDISPEGQLLVNGSAANEEIFYATYLISGGTITYPLELPADSFFLLSDFRTNGYDSRNYGTVAREEIDGKVITVMRRRGI
jgi:signal peptidase I